MLSWFCCVKLVLLSGYVKLVMLCKVGSVVLSWFCYLVMLSWFCYVKLVLLCKVGSVM